MLLFTLVIIKQVYGCTDCVIRVASFDDFVKQLQTYDQIDRLVIYTHSVEGALLINFNIKDLDAVEALFKGTAPAVTSQIDLEGCDVALRPQLMVPFGKVFKAPKVTAYNWFHIVQIVPLTKTKGATSDDVKKVLDIYDGFFVPNTPFDRIATQLNKGDVGVGVEWFRDTLDPGPLPTDTSDPMRKKLYKRRTDATERAVSSAKAADLGREYASTPIPIF